MLRNLSVLVSVVVVKSEKEEEEEGEEEEEEEEDTKLIPVQQEKEKKKKKMAGDEPINYSPLHDTDMEYVMINYEISVPIEWVLEVTYDSLMTLCLNAIEVYHATEMLSCRRINSKCCHCTCRHNCKISLCRRRLQF
ncbi:uncharacterized protein LOC122503129 [Leptopilina heterotoma]|uniref:uncharacterized protein LOC122503129 n=1 Tax=Leptopilina heterotoma TaxID=63436 RepID=UPI001CA915E4|nr:uncharacterized protein LOC122503129 [Leptopilina heterotoma]